MVMTTNYIMVVIFPKLLVIISPRQVSTSQGGAFDQRIHDLQIELGNRIASVEEKRMLTSHGMNELLMFVLTPLWILSSGWRGTKGYKMKLYLLQPLFFHNNNIHMCNTILVLILMIMTLMLCPMEPLMETTTIMVLGVINIKTAALVRLGMVSLDNILMDDVIVG